MLCHKCPHSKEIERLTKICSECSDKEIENPSGEGRVKVSIDAMCDPSGLYDELRAKPVQEAEERRPTSLPPEVEARLREELAQFLRLSYLNQMLLVWIMRGGSLAEFGRMEWLPKGVADRGFVTRQAMNERLATIKKTCPDIAGVIEQMVRANSGSRGKDLAKQKPGRRHKKNP